MALIKRFEDILAWQEARKMVKDVYQITREGAISKDFGLRDQFQRAAVSIEIFKIEYAQAKKTKALIGGLKKSLKSHV